MSVRPTAGCGEDQPLCRSGGERGHALAVVAVLKVAGQPARVGDAVVPLEWQRAHCRPGTPHPALTALGPPLCQQLPARDLCGCWDLVPVPVRGGLRRGPV